MITPRGKINVLGRKFTRSSLKFSISKQRLAGNVKIARTVIFAQRGGGGDLGTTPPLCKQRKVYICGNYLIIFFARGGGSGFFKTFFCQEGEPGRSDIPPPPLSANLRLVIVEVVIVEVVVIVVVIVVVVIVEVVVVVVELKVVVVVVALVVVEAVVVE